MYRNEKCLPPHHVIVDLLHCIKAVHRLGLDPRQLLKCSVQVSGRLIGPAGAQRVRRRRWEQHNGLNKGTTRHESRERQRRFHVHSDACARAM